MKELLIIANLGRVRSVKFKRNEGDPVEQDHLVEDPAAATVENPVSRGDVVTDQSGRFGRGAPAGQGGGMSYGEQHNLDSELERKALRRIAERIDVLVAEEGGGQWILAAPQPILTRLQRALSPASRASLADTVGADLTKEPLAKLEQRFGVAG